MRPLTHLVNVVTKMSENPLVTGLRGLKDTFQRVQGMHGRTAATAPHLAIREPPLWQRWLLTLVGCYGRYKERQATKALEAQKKDNQTFEATLIEAKCAGGAGQACSCAAHSGCR